MSHIISIISVDDQGAEASAGMNLNYIISNVDIVLVLYEICPVVYVCIYIQRWQIRYEVNI